MKAKIFITVILTILSGIYAYGWTDVFTYKGLKFEIVSNPNEPTYLRLIGGTPKLNMFGEYEINVPNHFVPEGTKYRGCYDVKEIAANAFYGNKSVQTVWIESEGMTIESGAFQNCTNLKSLHFKQWKGNLTLKPNSFTGCNISKVEFNPNVKVNYNGAFDPSVKILVDQPQKVEAPTTLANGCVTMSDVSSNTYDPVKKKNYTGAPLIIVTYVRRSPNTIKAKKLLPDYLKSIGKNAQLLFVDIELSPCNEWIDKMDIAAEGSTQKSYSSPIFYFINSDGSASRFHGFVSSYINTSNSSARAQEFRRKISNLR